MASTAFVTRYAGDKKMPPVSQAQRKLMYAAAAKKGGAGGVPQKVAKDFVASDKPGKLPPHVSKKAKKSPLNTIASRRAKD